MLYNGFEFIPGGMEGLEGDIGHYGVFYFVIEGLEVGVELHGVLGMGDLGELSC